MTMKKYLGIVLALALLAGTSAVLAEEEPTVDKKQAKRAAIDEMASDALTSLMSESDHAKGLYDEAVGFAVFDNFKFTFLLSGGGGVGVAVDKASGQRTYMKMGSGGVGVGLGGHSYQVVLLFDNRDRYEKFVNKGWQADLSANAAAGTSGKNAPSTFSDGVAVFQMTNKGLVAQADIAGTKYWKNKKLNQ
jgi:lipid-binding SYLF domain-containing protein